MQPLAYRMRPQTLADIVGQEHLVGPGKIITRMVESKLLSSMILYGPPGIGKTSIASAIAGSTKYAFRKLNAATDSKQDLKIVAEEGKMSGTVILLLDEIHRLDKTKQDFLLPLLESGQIILIGATTENPYISTSPAIRSRTQIFELEKLSDDDVAKALQRAITDEKNGLGKYHVNLQPDAQKLLLQKANGDLRATLNSLELAVLSTAKEKHFDPDKPTELPITIDDIQNSIQTNIQNFDLNGDAHYNTISAFQKAIRGSDTDAALHYLARLIESGDLVSISRRLLVIAYEDVGLANPNAAAHAAAAIESANKLGFPEARIPLANAVIELSLSPKSNSAITAIDEALSDIRTKKVGDIPSHLLDSHYSGAEKLGKGVGYKYAHNFDHHWVAQQYLPNNLQNASYYHPSSSSKLEKSFAEQYQTLKKLQKDGLKKDNL